jgi:acetoin utilization deacetylase AcuC-like enzyme
MARTAFITHEDCVKHEMTPGHPEQPARIGAVLNELVAQGLFQMLQRFEAVEVTRDRLLLAHPQSHVDHVFSSAPDGSDPLLVPLDPDTALNQYSLRAALLAAGAGVQAVDLVVGDEFDNAFCCVRPPGHHAEKTQAMGFCFFGSVAIAALHALEQPGIERVAVIDFDVHHGNGTEDLIGDHDSIFFCSSFQHPFYPGKFGPNVAGRKINIPLDAGTDGAVFKAKMESECLPALEAFKPDMVLISAGFDAHKDDPLGGLNWTENDFAWITRELMGVAERHCEGRLVSMLEGGYNLDALGTSAAVHVKTLLA